MAKEADKWIRFEKLDIRENFWIVKTIKTDEALGFIKYYPAWRHYCFFPMENTVFSDRCMIAIARFIQKLEKERKK
jgi:hypothetical protein